MAQAVLAETKENASPQMLLAACKAVVCILKDKQWQLMYDSKAFRLQLARNVAGGGFVIYIVDEQQVQIQAKINLRFNTVFKTISNDFFSLLEEGTTVWGFKIIGKASDAQTFAIVVQNSLASLKELINKSTGAANPASQSTVNKKEVPGDPQCYLNNICLTLTDAINRGNETFASDLARQLASQKALVSIKLVEQEKVNRPMDDNKINIKVQVEDKESVSCQFRLDVPPQTTVQQLKQLVEVKYNFPARVQHWIIGKRLPKAMETLADCGIKKSGSTLFLYLISGKTAPEQDVALHKSPSDSFLPANTPVVYDANRFYESIEEFGQTPQRVAQATQSFPVVMQPSVGWMCPTCTFLNDPTRPGCEMCAAGRPADYQIPQHYLPNEREKTRMELERHGEHLIQQEEERVRRLELEERDRNLQRLLSVIDQPLVTNTEEFECPICFDNIGIGEGVVLRECLHNFCRECLADHIRNSEEPEVQCPFNNGDFACHDVITPQEIQELLTEEDYEKYLQRSLSTAESQAANSFHCQTPNCNGWCIYDDEVNVFDCPVCGQKNCLTCKAIHHPINCKEYQDDLRRNATNDEAARKTQEYLEHMLRTKDGMNCPRCGIILVKKDGCDWMRCTMCKTEICWAVRGPRWGPGGNGDTSGGCKCRINNAKCDPNCRNCH